MFNVESAGELDAIERRARHSGNRPTFPFASIPTSRRTRTLTSRPGSSSTSSACPRTRPLELFRRAAAPGPAGSRHRLPHRLADPRSRSFRSRRSRKFSSSRRRSSARASEVEFLDLGGGYGIRYVDEKPLDLDRLAAELRSRLAGTPYRLILEPGRALVGNAGVLLPRVLYVKRNQQEAFCGRGRRHERPDAPHALRLLAPDCSRRTPHGKNLSGRRGGAALRNRRLSGARPRNGGRRTRATWWPS